MLDLPAMAFTYKDNPKKLSIRQPGFLSLARKGGGLILWGKTSLIEKESGESLSETNRLIKSERRTVSKGGDPHSFVIMRQRFKIGKEKMRKVQEMRAKRAKIFFWRMLVFRGS